MRAVAQSPRRSYLDMRGRAGMPGEEKAYWEVRHEAGLVADAAGRAIRATHRGSLTNPSPRRLRASPGALCYYSGG